MKFALLALVLVSPAFAQEAAPNLPCAGLENSVDSKQLHTNLPRREQLFKRACDENGQLAQMVKGLEERLKSCQELGKDLQGNTHRIPVEAVVAQYKRRISEVCKQGLEANLKNMGGLCQAYGATAQKATGIPARIHDMENGTNSESAPYQALAQELSGIMSEFDGHRRAADAEAKRLGSQFSDITADGKDDDLARNVRTLRGQVGSFVTFMEEQARRRLADRQQHTAQNDPEAGVTMRWRTSADVQNFYRNLGKCKQAVREGGDADKFKDSVDNVLGKTMKDARQEAADLVAPLERKAADIKPKRDELLTRAGKIRTEADNNAVAAARANGTGVNRSNPEYINPAYQRAQDMGLTYESLSQQAASCGLGKMDCYRRDGGEVGNPRSYCYKRGTEPSVCVLK